MLHSPRYHTSGKYPLAFSGSCYFYARVCNIELELPGSWTNRPPHSRGSECRFSPSNFQFACLDIFNLRTVATKLHPLMEFAFLVWRMNFPGIEFLFQARQLFIWVNESRWSFWIFNEPFKSGGDRMAKFRRNFRGIVL